MENVKIACAVYGPRQSTKQLPYYSEKGKLNVEVKYAPFASKRRRNPMRVRSLFIPIFHSHPSNLLTNHT